MSYDPHHGPYEARGPYRGDHLRRWIVAATEWKAEAVRLSAENRELRERLETPSDAGLIAYALETAVGDGWIFQPGESARALTLAAIYKEAAAQ